jgi:hypothetical protein
LAHDPRAAKDIVAGPIFRALVNCLSKGSNHEEKGSALQPLCNLVLNADNQVAFANAGGIPQVVALLNANHDKTKELALTLVSFVTTNHDSIRESLCDKGALAPLCSVINGDGTPKMQELAINSLVNLSLSEKAERAILEQNAVKPVTGLLASDVPKLQQQAAMLLSNLLTNREIREHIRYLGWVDPVINILKNGDAALLQQILRVIINVTFDAHCRYLLASADAEKHVANASKRVPDPTVNQLSTTALKNLTVQAPPEVQNEVENAKRGGKIQGVGAPKAQRREAKKDDLEGLDDLIGNISAGGNRSAGNPPAAHRPPPSQQRSAGNDGLDDLLSELNTPSSKPAPAPAKAAYSAPAHSAPAQHKPPPAAAYKAKPSNDLDDLDNLLAEVSTPAPKSQQNSGLSDIDDLLADIDTSSKKPAPTKAAYSAPAHSAPAKAPAPSKPAPKAADDIDDLLADIGSAPPAKHNPPASKSKPKNDLDDIDDLLDGMSSGSSNKHNKPSDDGDIDNLLADIEGGGGRPQSTYGASVSVGGDDIDDLLDGLGGSSNNKQGGGDVGMDAIDDLLADLTG